MLNNNSNARGDSPAARPNMTSPNSRRSPSTGAAFHTPASPQHSGQQQHQHHTPMPISPLPQRARSPTSGGENNNGHGGSGGPLVSILAGAHTVVSNTNNNNNKSIASVGVLSNNNNNNSTRAGGLGASMGSSRRQRSTALASSAALIEAEAESERQQREAAEAAPKKKRKQLCTVPLAAVFTLQCLLIIGAFAGIIVYASVQSEDTATDIIRASVMASLRGAGLEVFQPLLGLEDQLSEFRGRYYSAGMLTNGQDYPCNDQSVALLGPNATMADLKLQDSQDFYADELFALSANERISAAFVVTQVSATDIDWSSVQSYDDVAESLSQCSVSYTSLHRRYKHLSKITKGIPNMSTLMYLDSLPLNFAVDEQSADYHEDTYVIPMMTTHKMVNIPTVKAGLGTHTLFAAPLAYDVVWRPVAPATVGLRTRHISVSEPARLYENRADVERIQIISSVGFCIALMDFYYTVKAVTPDDPNAHTVLYDLSSSVLIATTRLPPTLQYNVTSETLFRAGYAPSARVNEVYYRSGIATQAVHTYEVTFDGDTIIGTLVFELPETGTLYGVAQSIPRDYYFAEIVQMRKVMIASGVACCVVVVLLCIAVAIGIFHGIQQLLANMALAAKMRNDRTSYIVTFISDIDRLAKGFGNMNDMLLEARVYLPQHMLLTTSSDESGLEDEGSLGDDGVADAAARTFRSAQHTETSNASYSDVPTSTALASSANRGTGGATDQSGNEGKVRKGRGAINNANVATKASPAAGATGPAPAGGVVNGMTLKRVTVLAINGRGVHRMMNILAPATVVATTTHMAEAVMRSAHAHKGVVDSFHGDHFVISFNAARANAEGPVRAAQTALAFADVGIPVNRFSAMGIASGRACVGNLGTATLKRLSIIGPVYSKAIALERLCRRFNPEVGKPLADDEAHIQVIIDSAMAADIQHTFELQVLGGVFGKPYGAPPRLDATNPPLLLPSAADGGGGLLGARMTSSTTKRSTADDAAIQLLGADSAMGKFIAQQQQQRGGSGGDENGDGGRQLEVVYALRAPAADTPGDEWLYELAANRSSHLTEMNNAMLGYLQSLPAARIAPPAAATNTNVPAATTSAFTCPHAAYGRALAALSEQLSGLRSRIAVSDDRDDVLVMTSLRHAETVASGAAHERGSGLEMMCPTSAIKSVNVVNNNSNATRDRVERFVEMTPPSSPQTHLQQHEAHQTTIAHRMASMEPAYTAHGCYYSGCD